MVSRWPVTGSIAVIRNPTGSPRLKRLCNAQLPAVPGLPRNNVTSPNTINFPWPAAGERGRLKRCDRRTLESEERNGRQTQDGSDRWIHGRSLADLRAPLQCTCNPAPCHAASSCPSLQRRRARPIARPHYRNSRGSVRSGCSQMPPYGSRCLGARSTNSGQAATGDSS